ncbi:D-aminoacylase [Sphingomonas sp. Leaf357]|uniref:N-acyl-D-amino-acid deacylase family protein n=1 Tax=Sphingomonas sp. Leaf357 TaxID=1736350 RepID=UPI0006FACBBD|nr:D-aminoacylase [Sphingomonas sp. Leaf357]KQS01991.1 D-aminoacylase [Sphingomonas sp. Leaf357]
MSDRAVDADLVIAGATVHDGSGNPSYDADIGIDAGVITLIAPPHSLSGRTRVEGNGLVLAPGFIDVHTHDDLAAIARPQMIEKLSQGVTTVIVGNCGISAGAGVQTPGTTPPDPMNLLGAAEEFRYPDFASYRAGIDAARPAVNVAALVGHTALRSAHMDRFDRAATAEEIAAMRVDLVAALGAGAIGLSTGLAYANAHAAPTAEVQALAAVLAEAGGLYATHLRDETAGILDALDEAFAIGRRAASPVVVSHLKCAGAGNHGRSADVLAAIERAGAESPVGCDCYPYTASASTLDLKQVVPETPILITWSDPEPGQAGRMLSDIAADWGVDLLAAAVRLQPAGAVYHCMADRDVERILAHPATMIGTDGLPNDPRPHPRLWGAFPRVLGHYARDRGLFPLATAVRKMTGLSADRFRLAGRGYVREGHAADLVLFDPATVGDAATFEDPMQAARGIVGVWVNGMLSLDRGVATGARAGRFLPRAPHSTPAHLSHQETVQ